jgi:hypothetical protein
MSNSLPFGLLLKSLDSDGDNNKNRKREAYDVIQIVGRTIYYQANKCPKDLLPLIQTFDFLFDEDNKDLLQNNK